MVELGEFPREVGELERLPGVGPYTARAIACFAFGAQVTALDTNVRRVLDALARGPPTWRRPPGRAWDWNQALFDLGAQICLARVPRCDALPAGRRAAPRADARSRPLRRQGRFEGSRRQRRAALVRELARGPARRRRLRSRTWSSRCSPTVWPCAAQTACWPCRRRSPHREQSRSTPPTRCSCLAVSPGERFQALVDEPFADVGVSLCDAALAAGAASAACVVVPDSARPLHDVLRAPARVARRRRRRSASGSRTSMTASSPAFRKPLYARASETGTRVAFGGRMDRSMLEHEMAADYGALRELTARLAGRLAGCERVRVTTPRGHRLHVRRDGPRVEARRRRARQPGAFGNLPAGEVFISPLATGADGVCVIDRSIALAGEGLVDEPIALTFGRGASSASRAVARPQRRARRSPRRAPARTSWPSSASARTTARASRAA